MKVPEIFFSVSEEVKLFFLSCLLGMAMGLFYDVFRTARLLIRHSALFTAAEDIAFILIWAVSLSAFASAMTLGMLRGFLVFGSILGFLIYLATIGRIIIGIMKKSLFIFRTAVSVIFLPLGKCFALIRKKATLKFVGSSKIFTLGIKKLKIVLPKSHNLLYNITENKKRRNVKNVGKKKKFP